MSANINIPQKIEIRPIPNRDGIRGFSQELEFFAQTHTISPFVNPVSRKYETGLSKEDLEYLESMNVPFDYKNDMYIRGIIHPFWESMQIKTVLEGTPTFLYPSSDILDFFKYKYLLASNYIYSSEEEMNSGAKPEATHFIFNEEKELEIKATKLEIRDALIQKVSKLSLAKKREYLTILLDENLDNKNESYIKVAFENLFEDKDKSVELELLLQNTAEANTILAEVKIAKQKNVLKSTKKGIFFFETNLGYSDEEVRDTLLKDQELYLSIKSKI